MERACRAGDEATAVSSIFRIKLGAEWPGRAGPPPLWHSAGRPLGQKSHSGPVLFCDSIHRGQVPEEREPRLAETAICLASVRALISERDSAGCG